LKKFKEHKLIIVDEIDNLSQSESPRKFINFLQGILKNDTNTTIIGIANSIDLLSKVSEGNKKENELVTQKLVFSPYTDQ